MGEVNQNQRRVSDVQFYIDDRLDVVEGNRSFLRFFDTPDIHINLSDYLMDFESENLKSCLKHFDDTTDNHYFIANIKIDSDTFVSILQINKDNDHPGLFRVDLADFSYSRQQIEDSTKKLRVYESLIHNFKTHYFTYDSGRFSLFCTDDLSPVFEGSLDEAKEKVLNLFHIDIEDLQTKFQFNLFFSDLLSGVSIKNYKFHTLENTFIDSTVNEISLRQKNILFGMLSDGNDVILTENAYSAQYDGMTNILNKKAITEMVRNKIEVQKAPFSLFIIDIDHFKEFNDNFGHSFGDKIIVTLANCLKDAVNGIGTAGRIGGDEFLCVLDSTDEEQIRSVARNIKLGLQWSIPADTIDALVTCSIGVARFPNNAATYEELFATADKCLYIAKSRGRNCYIIYRPDLHGPVSIEPDGKAKQTADGNVLMESALAELEIMSAFLTEKDDNISTALEMLLNYMKVHTITVYKWDGNSFSNQFAVGKTDKDNRKDFINKSYYFRNYNKSNFLHLDSTTVLDTVDRELFLMYVNAGINSTIEVLCKDERGENKALVCYDIYKPARTFETHKVVFALAAARLLSEKI